MRQETVVPIDRLHNGGRWPDDVAVYRIDVCELDVGLGRMMETLGEQERLRAGRYRQLADKARFVSTRYALRCLLAECVNALPANLRFNAGAHGKPCVTDYPALSFNVSHSGLHGLVAISSRRPVGIDIERIDSGFNWKTIAELVCSTEEMRSLSALRPPFAQHAFFHIWTAKEALVKALGAGIDERLPEIAVELPQSGMLRPVVRAGSRFAAAAEFQYRWIPELDGYAGCIAFADTASGD